MNPRQKAENLIHRFTIAERIYNSDIAKRKIAKGCALSVCQLMIQEFAKSKNVTQVGYWQEVENEICKL